MYFFEQEIYLAASKNYVSEGTTVNLSNRPIFGHTRAPPPILSHEENCEIHVPDFGIFFHSNHILDFDEKINSRKLSRVLC